MNSSNFWISSPQIMQEIWTPSLLFKRNLEIITSVPSLRLFIVIMSNFLSTKPTIELKNWKKEEIINIAIKFCTLEFIKNNYENNNYKDRSPTVTLFFRKSDVEYGIVFNFFNGNCPSVLSFRRFWDIFPENRKKFPVIDLISF